MIVIPILNPIAIKCINLLIVTVTILFVGLIGIAFALLIWHVLGALTRWARHEIWKLQRR